MYEPPNRGGKTWANIARFSGSTNDPASQRDPAILDNNFFLPRGYTIVFSGWDQAAGTNNANFVTTIDLSKTIPQNVTGPGYDYIVTGAATFTLTYPANSIDKGKATLTHGCRVQHGHAACVHVHRERHLRAPVHGQEPDREQHRARRHPRLQLVAPVGENR
jgi:hypothetical protein